jgi:hypothetical protein
MAIARWSLAWRLSWVLDQGVTPHAGKPQGVRPAMSGRPTAMGERLRSRCNSRAVSPDRAIMLSSSTIAASSAAGRLGQHIGAGRRQVLVRRIRLRHRRPAGLHDIVPLLIC